VFAAEIAPSDSGLSLPNRKKQTTATKQMELHQLEHERCFIAKSGHGAEYGLKR
jgi:hypothetical protein